MLNNFFRKNFSDEATFVPAGSVAETPVAEVTPVETPIAEPTPTTNVEEPVVVTPVQFEYVKPDPPIVKDFENLFLQFENAITAKLELVSRLKGFANSLKTVGEDIVADVEQTAPVTAIEKLYAKLHSFEQSNNTLDKIVTHLETII